MGLRMDRQKRMVSFHIQVGDKHYECTNRIY